MKNDYCVVLHAYSSTNSGDGLLVDTTIERIKKTKLYSRRKIVVCIDKQSFRYLESRYENLKVVSIFEYMKFALLNRASNISFVAVGGGYLRSGNFIEGIKCLLAHGSQIALLSWFKNSKSVYLPQSIGPLEGATGRSLAYLLRKYVDTIFVRDEKSLNELSDFNIKNVQRSPDLVAASILARVSEKKLEIRPPEKTYLVVRDLSSRDYSEDYIKNIKRLYDELDNVEVVIQAFSRGNNDESFAERTFGLKGCRSLKEALTESPGIVISARLHGSLESVLNNNISIHLAYERKGIAAYKDLCVEEYVHHCSNLDVDKIKRQVSELMQEPGRFNALLYKSDSYKDTIHQSLINL